MQILPNYMDAEPSQDEVSEMTAYDFSSAKLSAKVYASDEERICKASYLIESSVVGLNKWQANGSCQQWVMVDFLGSFLTVHGIGFKSADNEPSKDPRSV